ncbi:MAG: single-stranded-DNA-specific exonuclease RecJ [Deltaproteobacteria bacterium]|nr:single-stranded-DNA-specific exonuclease RecJ [Deltaproteobacteria bacterium]
MDRSPKKKWQWRKPATDTSEQLVRSLGCHPVIARLLNNRSVFTSDDALRFLEPSLSHLRPPHHLLDIEKAAARIIAAVDKKENILIFGDYDVDGITATTLLYRFLDSIGARVSYLIPHRINEGYGLKPVHVSLHAVSRKISLIITVDCGTSDHDAVAEANRRGIDVIVTDHHEPPDELPPALAIVNPKRKECSAGMEFLAGVGVIFYLLIYLRMQLRERGYWRHGKEPNLKAVCDLVAVGTIADMVPLRHENRVLACTGLNTLQKRGNRGMRALMERCGVDRSHVGARDIAFRIAPRLNAAGRVDHADTAMALLSTGDNDEAILLAERLHELNKQRQSLEKAVIADIDRHLTDHPENLEGDIIVLCAGGWHLGILGIVASRMVNRYARPAVVLTQDGEVAKGSARSVPGIDLSRLLSACSGLLISHGGHAMAAGLQIAVGKIDAFRQALNQAVQDRTIGGKPAAILPIDGPLDFRKITRRLTRDLEMLKPFGEQNPPPLFVADHVRVLSSKIVGGGHRRMFLRQTRGPAFQAIHFNPPTETVGVDVFEKVAFQPQFNRWNGREEIQLLVKDVLI